MDDVEVIENFIWDLDSTWQDITEELWMMYHFNHGSWDIIKEVIQDAVEETVEFRVVNNWLQARIKE